jgi:UDPglucose 6-dehydrogenase
MAKADPDPNALNHGGLKIAIIGTGYIGLVTGVCLAHIGHTVICVDNNPEKIAQLRKGHIPIFEPGLEQLMAAVISEGRLTFSSDGVEAARQSDCIMLAVGTPTAEDGVSSDLTHVFNAARNIAGALTSYKTIVVKSTVPVGTGAGLERAIMDVNPTAEFDMASNPEFLKEGAAIADFMTPDRIVIGTQSPRALEMMQRMYTYFSDRNFTFLNTSIETAELIKFASNAFLATKIAFINEMAELCEVTGADVKDVARGMGLDDRIGPKFLQSGPGFGGSCFPKDIRALSALAKSHQVQLRITDAVIGSNAATQGRMVDKIIALAGGDVAGKTLTVFGVTFKPDTDDMREAPSLTILPALMARGAVVRVVDPEGRKHGEALLPCVVWFEDGIEAAANSDMVVVLTEWQVFKTIDLKQLAQGMRRPVIADLRNIYMAEDLMQAGFVGLAQVGVTHSAR